MITTKESEGGEVENVKLCTKGELARVAEVFLSKQVRNQYPVLVQMFVEDPAKYLDASLLDGVLATLGRA